MTFKNSLKIQMKKAFSSFAGRRLTSGPRPKPAQRSPRARLASPRPSPARWLLLPRAAPVAAPRPDRVRTLSPRGDHASASPAARQPRPAPAPMRPPSTAAASALAHSRPRCLPSPPEPRAPKLCPSARPRTRRRNSPRLLHLGRKSHARSSASPSFKSRSRLRRLPSSG